MAGQGERAAAAALRRHTADVALGAGLRTQLHAEKFRANSRANLLLALHSLRSLQESGAEPASPTTRTNGVMKIYRSNDALDAARVPAPFSPSMACCSSVSDANAVFDLEPALADTGPTLAGGLYFARDEVGDCNKFTQGSAPPGRARRALPLRQQRDPDRGERRTRERRRHRQGRIAATSGRGHGQLLAGDSARRPASACRSTPSRAFPSPPARAWNSAPKMR